MISAIPCIKPVCIIEELLIKMCQTFCQNLVHKYNLNSNQFLVSQSLINDYSVNQRVTIESLLLQQFHDHVIVYTHHAITLEVQ
jgi:hypothetical protein